MYKSIGPPWQGSRLCNPHAQALLESTPPCILPVSCLAACLRLRRIYVRVTPLTLLPSQACPFCVCTHPCLPYLCLHTLTLLRCNCTTHQRAPTIMRRSRAWPYAPCCCAGGPQGTCSQGAEGAAARAAAGGGPAGVQVGRGAHARRCAGRQDVRSLKVALLLFNGIRMCTPAGRQAGRQARFAGLSGRGVCNPQPYLSHKASMLLAAKGDHPTSDAKRCSTNK